MSIVEMMGEIVARVADKKRMKINYTFGSAQYIKDKLDVLSKSRVGTENKLPMIALFCPVKEDRSEVEYLSTARINLIIACSTRTDWTNEERLNSSFIKILRPIYDALMSELKADRRFDWGYDVIIQHTYSENYSYGRYGAYTDDNKKVSEPIDAIDIRDLRLKVKQIHCNRL